MHSIFYITLIPAISKRLSECCAHSFCLARYELGIRFFAIFQESEYLYLPTYCIIFVAAMRVKTKNVLFGLIFPYVKPMEISAQRIAPFNHALRH